MEDNDFHWLCGLLEGEGSFMKGPPSQPHYPIIQLSLTDEDVIQRVSLYFGVKYQTINKRQSHWKQCYTIRIYGKKAVELMTKMRPFMGRRRQTQIDKAIACYETRPNHGPSRLTEKQIREIKRLLLQETTSRKIAESVGCSKFSVLRIKNHGAFPDVQI